MGVSKKDRDDYERGQRDRKADVVIQTARDLTSPSKDSEAYDKGRRGESLDGDKKK